MAYRVAALTGFRVNELRALAPENFLLDGPYPRIVLRPADSKNRKGADQPIPVTLADELRPWLEKMSKGSPVFSLHRETARMIRQDLRAAEIAYETDEGHADFHSLRGLYISALIRAGASIKTVQTLARHSNPSLTLARYARVDVHDVRGAVEALPVISHPVNRVQTLAQTGTDSGSELPVNSGHIETVADANCRNRLDMSTEVDASQPQDRQGFSRSLSVADRL